MPREHDGDLQGSYFGLEMDGLKVGYFTACSGLSVELEPVKFKQTTETGKMIETKRPGRPKYTEIVLKRGFTKDKALYDWFDQIVKADKKTTYKTGSIVIFSREFKEVARFSFDNCWPSKLTVSDLTTGSDEVMIEELTIQHEFLDWV